jgi:DNA (cytosine-5)-methyltransferase 1
MTQTPSRRDRIKVLDLFAGAGGLSAGLHQASERFDTVRAVEMDRAAAASYDATFGDERSYAGSIQDWLAEEDVPEVDVIVGGPPCQGFSTLGKQDAEDTRNFLWREYAETIARAQPRYFVVENVAAFAKSSQFEDFTAATAPGGQLDSYGFEHRVLNAADYGTPQARKRAVVIGWHRDLNFPGWPTPTHSADGVRLPKHRTVADAIRGIPTTPDMDETFHGRKIEVGGLQFTGAFSPRELHVSRTYSELSRRRFREIPAGGNRFDLPDSLLADCWRKHSSGSADVMGRLHWNRPSVTIRTEFFKPEKGRYLHPDPNIDRAITHYEAAKLQGFPDSHRFVGSRTAIAKQIGNAVPIPLGAAIGRQLASAL